MARVVALIVVTVAAIASLVVASSPGNTARAVSPPIACPGGVSSTKATGILQYDAGLIVFIRLPEDSGMNTDGSVNSVDGFLVLQCVAGLIPTLPVL